MTLMCLLNKLVELIIKEGRSAFFQLINVFNVFDGLLL